MPDLQTGRERKLNGMSADTLCWNCSKACTEGCSWSRDKLPVSGWIANKNEKYKSYHVIACPEFLPDTERKFDLNINGCQNLVAGIIRTAVNDYMQSSPKCTSIRKSVETFIQSKQFGNMCTLDPEWLIQKLRKDYKAKMTMMLRDEFRGV